MNGRSGNAGALMMGVVIGGLVGAGITLLSAPHSGEETRTLIRQKSNELKDKAVNTYEENRARAEDVVQKGKERLAELKQRSRVMLSSDNGIAEIALPGAQKEPAPLAE